MVKTMAPGARTHFGGEATEACSGGGVRWSFLRPLHLREVIVEERESQRGESNKVVFGRRGWRESGKARLTRDVPTRDPPGTTHVG